MALYHKYRPQRFDDLVGQDHVRKILQEALKQGLTVHGYLFAGPRGLGKTTTARLLAKALNCLKNDDKLICNGCIACLQIQEGRSLDVIEIDAASNRGIDEIRELREKIKFLPTTNRYKVYIIDEVHMLTKEAFNALLKTLEEPPKHAIFVLATTEPHKVPATIISRVQRFDFKRPALDVLLNWLGEIAKKEKIKIDKEALIEVAQLADGSFRDAITLLEQLAATGQKITSVEIAQVLGLPTKRVIGELVDAMQSQDAQKAIALIEQFYGQGVDFGHLQKQLIITLRNKMISEANPGLAKLINRLLLATEQSKFSPLPQIPLELVVIEWSDKIKMPADIRDKWQEIIETIKPFNHSLVAILQDTKVIGLDGEILKVTVKFPFYKDRIEDPKNHQKIAEAVTKILGRKARVVCEVDKLPQQELYHQVLDIFDAQESPESTELTP